MSLSLQFSGRRSPSGFSARGGFITLFCAALLCTVAVAQDYAEGPGEIEPEQGAGCVSDGGACDGEIECCSNLVCQEGLCIDECLEEGETCASADECCDAPCTGGVCTAEVAECGEGDTCDPADSCCESGLECDADSLVCTNPDPECAAAGDACSEELPCCTDADPALTCSAETTVCEVDATCAAESEACDDVALCCEPLVCSEATSTCGEAEAECGVSGAACTPDDPCCVDDGLTCQAGECAPACAADGDSCDDAPCCTDGAELTCQEGTCAPAANCAPEGGACGELVACCPDGSLVCTQGECVADAPCANDGEQCSAAMGCCTDTEKLTCQTGTNGAMTCAPEAVCVNASAPCDETTPCCPDQGLVCGENGTCTEAQECAAEGEPCGDGCCNTQGTSLTCQEGTCQPPSECAFAGGACGATVSCCSGQNLQCVDDVCSTPQACVARGGVCSDSERCCSGSTCLEGSCAAGAPVGQNPPPTSVTPGEQTASQPAPSDEDDGGIGTGAIAGIAIAAVLVVGAAALFGVFALRKHRASGGSAAKAGSPYEAKGKPDMPPGGAYAAGGAGAGAGIGGAAAVPVSRGSHQSNVALALADAGSPVSSYGTGEIPFYEPTGVDANPAVNPYDAPSTDLPTYAHGPDPAFAHYQGASARSSRPSRVSSQAPQGYASGSAGQEGYGAVPGQYGAERAPSDYARHPGSPTQPSDAYMAAGGGAAAAAGTYGAYRNGHADSHVERASSGGSRRPSSRSNLPAAPSGLSYGQSTRASQGHPDSYGASKDASFERAPSRGTQSRTTTADWLTTDGRVSTVSAPDLKGRLENALDNLAMSGEPFLGRFVILSAMHRRKGGQGIVQFARGTHDGQDYAIKFFTARNAFHREEALYSNKVLRDMMPAVKHIEPNADSALRSASGWPMPPCIVIERGESLDKWAERLQPDFPTILQVLCHVTTRLQRLHEAGLAHRDLKPGNVLWRPEHLEWTLIDFGCAAHIGDTASLAFSPRYAAPEVLQAFESGEKEILVTAATDIWALGVMAFELLTDAPAFDRYTPQKDIIAALCGRQPLPWEDPEVKDAKLRQLRMLKRSITKCLSRDAAERPSAEELLASWEKLFDSMGPDATVVPTPAGPVKAGTMPVGL